MELESHLPDLSQYGYTAKRYLETDSKMSTVLLGSDHENVDVVIKVAQVDQRNRAEANRLAIRNEGQWLKAFRGVSGIVQIQTISGSGTGRLTEDADEGFVGTLDQWPDAPPFLVVEYLPGDALSTYIGQDRLPVHQALHIAHQIAHSLVSCHRARCVHRDLKPENILFESRPSDILDIGMANPTLIDFGVAAQAGENKLVSGSRLWMAPELQEEFERNPVVVDPAWDIYALGLILCYMISGRRPRRRTYDYASYLAFQSHTFRVIDQEAEQFPTLGNGVGARIKRLIQQSMTRQPAMRPTATEFSHEVAQILDDLGSPVAMESVVVQPLPYQPDENRNWLWLIIVTFLTALLLVGALVTANRDLWTFNPENVTTEADVNHTDARVAPDVEQSSNFPDLEADSESAQPGNNGGQREQDTPPTLLPAPPTLIPQPLAVPTLAPPTLIPITQVQQAK